MNNNRSLLNDKVLKSLEDAGIEVFSEELDRYLFRFLNVAVGQFYEIDQEKIRLMVSVPWSEAAHSDFLVSENVGADIAKFIEGYLVGKGKGDEVEE